MEEHKEDSDLNFIGLRSRRVPRFSYPGPVTTKDEVSTPRDLSEPEPEGNRLEEIRGEGKEKVPIGVSARLSELAGDYRDAKSSPEGSQTYRAQPGARVGGQSEMERERQSLSPGTEGGDFRDELDEERGSYGEMMRDFHRRTGEALAHSMKELCKEVGRAFTKNAEEKNDIIRTLIEQQQTLLRELAGKTSGHAERAAGSVQEPMPFNGANPREWLLQMQQYYDLRGFSEELRLKDVPFRLRGDAHMFYYTLVQHYPERIPKTWAGFVKLLTQRFSSRTPVETLQRLLQIKYRDSVSDVTTQFARVCAEGDPLPQDKLIHVYLSRFPKTMVDEAMKEDFSTWVEASEYLQRQNRRLTMKLAEWYQLAPPEFKREVEMDKQCMREGWILKNPVNTNFKSLPPGRQGLSGKGAEANRGVPAVARNQQGQEKPNFNKFLETLVCHQCQGRGHRVKDCPSRDLATRRDGSRCRKCGGLGHWASSCPSPRPRENFQREAQPAAQPATPQTAVGKGGNGRA